MATLITPHSQPRLQSPPPIPPRGTPRQLFFLSPPAKSKLLSLSVLSSSSSSSSLLPKHNRITSSTTTPRALPASTSSSLAFDVVVIGAGIIGLTIARQFLLHSDLSVAVVDKAVPCSGATGAGQGYLWMVHKSPGSETWDLTMRSHHLWRMFAESVLDQGFDPLEALGWKKTGSLLVGRTHEETVMLKQKVKKLSEAGLRAHYLSTHDLHSEEPAVDVGDYGGAAFLPDDYQLDAQRSVAFILKANRNFASKGRYAEFYHEPVTSLLRSGNNGDVVGVLTSSSTIYGKIVIVAAGCWSGSLTDELLREVDIELKVPVQPRKGHLLVLEDSNLLKLNHGLMEVGYVGHQLFRSSAPELVSGGGNLSISMTATMDTTGKLVLGSSRQFAGFSSDVNEDIVNHIWERAGDFFPRLKELPLRDFTRVKKARIGLRPYMPDGKPVIGPVPSLSNVFISTGHEGGGLSMALGTAEMVADMVLGNRGTVDCMPFAVQGRCWYSLPSEDITEEA